MRIVHVGLGAFHRAHQAWYTAHASDSGDCGIAAFTGRDPRAAEALSAQECLYTLIERSADGDRVEVVPSIVAAHDGADLAALRDYAARPQVAIISLTVTESGYRLTPDGTPNFGDPALADDVAAMAGGGVAAAAPTTVLGRLLTALDARRSAAAGPVAVVPCDNVPDNGAWLRSGTLALAHRVDPTLEQWIAHEVSFVSSSVDRITPRTTDADREVSRDAGWIDAMPVVTEPFCDWTICGEFPAGRPRWEDAGARFVDDLEPYERRKLWLLNGAHSLMAAAGLNRGLETIADAAADADIWSMVEDYWAEAVAHLGDSVDHVDYRRQLRDRFTNSRIVHRLAQVASDASAKLGVRQVAVARLERAAGLDAAACARAIAEWIASLDIDSGATDAQADAIDAARTSADPVRALVALLAADLAEDAGFMATVRAVASSR